MTVQDNILHYWAQEVANTIVNKTIYFLQNQKDLTSGDDTCLENNWEEYSMQVQYEESIAWDAYMDHIESLFERYFDDLSNKEQLTLWIDTEEGYGWYISNDKNIDFKHEQAPVFFYDCIKGLMSKLNDIAMNFESDNIINYVEYNCNGLELEIDEELQNDVLLAIGGQITGWEDTTANLQEVADYHLHISLELVQQVVLEDNETYDNTDGVDKVSVSPLGWERYLELKAKNEQT